MLYEEPFRATHKDYSAITKFSLVKLCFYESYAMYFNKFEHGLSDENRFRCETKNSSSKNRTDNNSNTECERLFYSSISSPYTQRVYRTYLQKYQTSYGMKNISELITKDHKEIERQIIDFIITSKEKGMKRVAIANYTYPAISFCKINDIMLNTMKISKFMPPQVRTKKTFGYDHGMIQKLLDIADERMRVVILLASQCGLRIGAIPGLDVGSCEEYKGLYKITVYEN